MTPRPLLLAHLAHARQRILDLGETVGEAIGHACAGHLDAGTRAHEALTLLRREAKERGLRDPVACIDAALLALLDGPDAQDAARLRALLPMACSACGKKPGDPCGACVGGRCWWPQKTQPAGEGQRVEDREQPVLSLHDNDAPGKSAPSRLT